MATIGISNLRKSFGAVDVLRDINVSIADGEFLVLVGPSGCGKSTLLRIISGLEYATSGTILIDGKDVTALPAKSRDIAMVFQSYALYPHMTVAENMGFSLKLRGEAKHAIAERVKSAALTLGLSDLLHRKPAALSGGQRQRVAMGRAIVRNPKVFLFDEPLSNLDAKLRVAMRGEIKALHQRLKTTIVYVTHDQVEALTMADRIVVMRGGIIEQVGTPMELFDQPANTFVAQFIGSPAMNLLAGEIDERGKSVKLQAGGSVTFGKRDARTTSGKLLVGVRPEHFALTGDSEPIAAQVNLVEPMGSQVQLMCRAGEEQISAVFNERLTLRLGDSIKLYPSSANMHLFDAGTGERID